MQWTVTVHSLGLSDLTDVDHVPVLFFYSYTYKHATSSVQVSVSVSQLH